MMGRSPQYYIPSFVAIGLPVPEKESFEEVLPYMAPQRSYWSCDPDATNKRSSPLPKEAPKKFGFDQASGFRGEGV